MNKSDLEKLYDLLVLYKNNKKFKKINIILRSIVKDEETKSLKYCIYKRNKYEKFSIINDTDYTDDTDDTDDTNDIDYENESDMSIELLNDKEYTLRRQCYICKIKYLKKHIFYNNLCNECGTFNYSKRFQRCDLSNKNIIITGGRVKIGFYTALLFLKCGANVLITTRFPKDALYRFSEEETFNEWKDRLLIYGPLDLKNIINLSDFISFVKTKFNKIHILINNAAQTVKRDSRSYLLLKHYEQTSDINNNYLNISVNSNSNSSKDIILKPYQCNNIILKDNESISDNGEIITSIYGEWGYQKINDIDPMEMLDVLLINVFSPFVLNSKLFNLMNDKEPSFIINITSKEGQFNVGKNSSHPHINMSKSSINMMTRTASSYYSKYNIYMNSVDPGWVDTVDDWKLDYIDGASRIFDPIYKYFKHNEITYGHLLKNYKSVNW